MTFRDVVVRGAKTKPGVANGGAKMGQEQRAAASMNPFAHAPYDMGSALAGMFLGAQPPERSGSAGPPPEEASSGSEVAAMRRELDALKESLKLRKPRRANRR